MTKKQEKEKIESTLKTYYASIYRAIQEKKSDDYINGLIDSAFTYIFKYTKDWEELQEKATRQLFDYHKQLNTTQIKWKKEQYLEDEKQGQLGIV